MLLKKIKNIAQKNNIVIDVIIVPKIILIKASKNKFCGYRTTILSNSGLKIKVPALKKVLWNIPNTKSKFKFDKKISKILTRKFKELPDKTIINNLFAIFLKFNSIKKASEIKNKINKIMEK